MARKTTKKQGITEQNELLLPALALSAVALTLVGVLTTGVLSRPTPEASVSAASVKARLLTKGSKVQDLEADLLLLQEDTLDSEIGILDRLD